MAVIPSALGGYTPHCSSCGIALCFDIGEDEYRRMASFWDEWRCEVCNPNVRGTYLRARQEANVQTIQTIAETIPS